MKKSFVLHIGGIILGVLVLVSASAQTDPQAGTWVLDVSKSTYSPGPALRSQTVVYTATPLGLKVAANGLDAAGKPTTNEFTLTFDGKDYAENGAPGFDALSARRIDSHTIEFTRKRAGKSLQTATRTVSKDGKIATLTITGVDGQGGKMHNVVVYLKK